MKKSIVWLASYPKSGNTWMRLFLANYLVNPDKPIPINQIHRFGMGDSIPKMYEMVAGRSIDTTNSEVSLALRDRVLQGIVANKADVNFVKTHNICKPAFGTELIPEKYTRCAIYIMRNPLDMLLSYARHFGMTHEDTVEAINNSENANAPDQTTVWQFLGSWTDHARSWTEVKDFPILTMRYEDMLEKPMETFGKAVEFLGVPLDQDRLAKAVEFASFKEVRKQEDETGFAEKSRNTDRFFSKGSSGQWADELSPELIKKVRQQNKKLMKKYGYYSV